MVVVVVLTEVVVETDTVDADCPSLQEAMSKAVATNNNPRLPNCLGLKISTFLCTKKG